MDEFCFRIYLLAFNLSRLVSQMIDRRHLLNFDFSILKYNRNGCFSKFNNRGTNNLKYAVYADFPIGIPNRFLWRTLKIKFH